MRFLTAAIIASGLLACANKGAAKPAAEPKADTWHFKGTRLIACCCNAPCPCRINKPPTQAHGCEYTTAVHIDQGHIGKVRMDGLTWLQVGLGFGEDVNKNWVIVYVSDSATDEQFKALQEWMAAGMKMINDRKLPYLAGAFAGFKKVPMTWTHDRSREEYQVTVRNILDLKVKTLRNPGHPEPVTSTGVFDDFGNSFVHANTLVHSYKDSSLKYDGWDLKGKQSNHANFEIGSDVKPDFVVGWGCWSAHKDFGAQDKYVERDLGHPKK